MPSAFDAIDAALQATVAGNFGEAITIRPMAGDPNLGGFRPDAERAILPGVRAILSFGGDTSAPDYASSARSGAISGTQPSEAWFEATVYAALAYELRRGDIIEREDGKRFAISPLPPTVQGDVQCYLTAAP